MAAPRRTRGWVLRQIEYSNTSQIVTVFTRDEGLVSLLAKGSLSLSRRSSSFPAPFDVTGWYDIVYRQRKTGVYLATEARLVEGFRHLRRDLTAYVEASFAIEATLRAFQPHDPHPQFLKGALSYLKLLQVGHGRLALRTHFVSELMRAAGWPPQWQHCCECGEPLSGHVWERLPAGAVCGSCRRSGENPLPEPLRHYLSHERHVSWGRVPHLDPEPAVLRAAWHLLRRMLLHNLERPLRSLTALGDARARTDNGHEVSR